MKIPVVAVASVLVLSACANIKIAAPVTDSVVMLPSNTAPTTVDIAQGGSGTTNNLRVTADGNDVSNLFTYQGAGSNLYRGSLPLAANAWHTVAASADAYCGYCTGQQYQATATTTFCVGIPNPAALPTRIAFAQRDNLAWSNSGAHMTVMATDTGMASTRWTLMPITNALIVAYATIRSAGVPCSCLHSPDNNKGTAVDLVPCDNSDMRQHWEGTRQQMSAAKGFYRFTNRAVADSGANWGCLTEGTGGALVQTDCTDTTDRLWSVFNNGLGMFEGGNMPW